MIEPINMQMLSFVSVEKQVYWSREWKHSIEKASNVL